MSDLKQFLSVESSSRAKWLDGGRAFAYLNNATGVNQLYRMELDTGETQPMTQGNERVMGGYQTLPGTGQVLFAMDKGGDELEQLYLLGADKQPRALTQGRARNFLGGLRQDGKTLAYSSNARNSACFDICALDIETGESRIVVQNEDHYNTPCGLSPCGRYLLYNKLKGMSDNMMWMADLDTGAARLVPEGGETAQYTGPAWKSDSSGFYLITDAGSEYCYVAYYDLALRKMTRFFSGDCDVEHISLSPDDRYLAIVLNEDGYSALRVCDLRSGAQCNVPQAPRGVIIGAPDWSPQGHKLLFTLTSAQRAMDVWVLDMEEDCLRRVTRSNMQGIGRDELVEPRLVHFASFDGLDVPFWLYVPLGEADKGLPVVIDIHGGPEGQERPDYNGVIQYLLSQGIAVAAPNIRGSVGYGKTYHHLDDKEKRLDSVRDIEAMVRFLVDSGTADPKKLAVMGASYGGFMTLSCVARYPDLWACGVDTVGMFNLETFLENTSAYRRAHRESEYGTLEHDREILRRVSPVAKVDQIKAPLMVIHGANDPRVPVSEAEQLVERMRERGVTVKYLRYEDEGHGLSKLKNKLDCYPQVAEFLKTHLGL